MKRINCKVCGVFFESEGLASCPAHSFGDLVEDQEFRWGDEKNREQSEQEF